jgi:hypothetical protein
MRKNKVTSLLLATAIAATLLTGCATSEQVVTQEAVEKARSTTSSDFVVSSKEELEPKVYQPYEHVFMIRHYCGKYAESISSIQISVPEGYEVVSIQNFSESEYKSSQTGGFDVWFVNTKTVEVTPVYNETFGYFDYSGPGTVIEELEEETNKTLTLTP